MNGIVVELNAGADFDAGVGGAQLVDYVQIDPFAVAIVIGEGDVGQSACACTVDPGLQQGTSVGLNAMTLRVAVVIGKELIVNS
jgi:hypothetical protein